jgi:hypothetical protein
MHLLCENGAVCVAFLFVLTRARRFSSIVQDATGVLSGLEQQLPTKPPALLPTLRRRGRDVPAMAMGPVASVELRYRKLLLTVFCAVLANGPLFARLSESLSRALNRQAEREPPYSAGRPVFQALMRFPLRPADFSSSTSAAADGTAVDRATIRLRTSSQDFTELLVDRFRRVMTAELQGAARQIRFWSGVTLALGIGMIGTAIYFRRGAAGPLSLFAPDDSPKTKDKPTGAVAGAPPRPVPAPPPHATGDPRI